MRIQEVLYQLESNLCHDGDCHVSKVLVSSIIICYNFLGYWFTIKSTQIASLTGSSDYQPSQRSLVSSLLITSVKFALNCEKAGATFIWSEFFQLNIIPI